jgi:hypothetical protein
MRELAAHAAQADVLRGRKLQRVAGIGQHHGAGLGDGLAVAVAHQPARTLLLECRRLAAVEQPRARTRDERARQARRTDPSAFRKPQPARGQRHSGEGARLARIDVLRVLGRTGERGDRRALRGVLALVARELQHAAALPLGGRADGVELAPVLEQPAERGAREARGVAVVGRHDRVKRARVIARGFHRRRVVAFHQRHLPAARGEPLAGGGAGEAGADHDGAALGGRRGSGAQRALRHEARHQHLAFPREAAALLGGEARRAQGLPHRRGHAPGGGGGAGRGKTRHRLEQRGRPHVGVLRRREAVEVDGIGGEAQLRQQPARVAEGQREHHAPVLEFEAVHARHRRRPRAAQLLGERRELRVRRVQHREGLRREWMLLHRDVVQARAALRILAPGLPGGEERQAEAETGFQHREAARAGPARGQAVAAEEHVARLRRAALRSVVDIAVGLRVRRAVGGEGEAGGGQRIRHRRPFRPAAS